ncbi:MAG: hypothetical protein JXA15_01675 [Spirochaetales bacterium]|nr:hypothetical protein [Spirochaetales bacterium]
MQPARIAARAIVLAVIVAVPLAASTGTAPRASGGSEPELAPSPAQPNPYRLFPSLYRKDSGMLVEGEEPLHGLETFRDPVLPAPQEDPGQGPETDPYERIPLVVDTDIVAFYGKPGAVRMGILGEYRKEELAVMLDAYVGLYDGHNGERRARGAFYIIYGTVWPEGEIGILADRVVREWVEFAAERGMLVFLDHQIGKYTVEQATQKLLPWLRYPNVHLALDPEWRTTKPMEEIGSITGDELNMAQRMVDDYLRENGLPGLRMLVVHQFNRKMIAARERVRADFDRVVLIHNSDGFGSPALKRMSYAMNAEAGNMPLKGFKLFFKSRWPGAGYDEPLLKPEEVLALSPRPVLIMYQ